MKHPLIFAPTTLVHSPQLECLRSALEAGYDGTGLRVQASPHLPFHPVVGDAPLVREIKSLLAELPLLDLYSFYLRPGTEVGSFMPALELGADLGAKYALVQGDDPDAARLQENFGRFCDAAAPLGLAAALEFVPRRAISTLRQALDLLQAVQRPNAFVLVDSLHFARAGHDPVELSKLELPYAQLSDGVKATGERRIPGEGELDLHSFMDALSVEIPLSVEVVPPKTGAPPGWARRVLEETRRFIEARASRRSA